MCVQDIDVQCVLQFTLIHAAGCALHRHTSRVIHRLEWFFCVFFPGLRRWQQYFDGPATDGFGKYGASRTVLSTIVQVRGTLCVGQKKWRTEERRPSSAPRRSVRVLPCPNRPSAHPTSQRETRFTSSLSRLPSLPGVFLFVCHGTILQLSYTL